MGQNGLYVRSNCRGFRCVISFLLIALAVFILVKAISKLHRKKEEEPKPEPKPDPQIVLLTEIRDLLKEKETSVDK